MRITVISKCIPDGVQQQTAAMQSQSVLELIGGWLFFAWVRLLFITVAAIKREWQQSGNIVDRRSGIQPAVWFWNVNYVERMKFARDDDPKRDCTGLLLVLMVAIKSGYDRTVWFKRFKWVRRWNDAWWHQDDRLIRKKIWCDLRHKKRGSSLMPFKCTVWVSERNPSKINWLKCLWKLITAFR